MPKVEIEIMRTRTNRIEESGVVVVTVPQKVIDDDGLIGWLEGKLAAEEAKGDHDLAKLVDGAMETSEDSTVTEYSSIDVLE